MIPIQLKEIAATLKVRCDEDITITGISTDSRKMTEGCLFVAIVGDKYDGHDFVNRAFELGACAALCSHSVDNPAGRILMVDDTVVAFEKIAAYYRSLFSIPVVGITGSVGKTTTKEMTWCVLNEEFNTLKTEGNLNNEIGLPTTVLRLDCNHEAAVIEMGMSHFGEISRLSRTAQPSIGIITKIGVSHIEFLGSREGILKAKMEITDGLKPGAPLLVNGDDDLLCSVTLDDRRVIKFGIDNPECDYTAKDIVSSDEGTKFTVCFSDKTQNVEIPCIGTHNVYNALSAFAAGIELGISPKKCAAGLSKYAPQGMRQSFREFHGTTIIVDCYNASPESVKAAVDVLKTVTARSKSLVFGDMFELGEHSVKAHADVGEVVAFSGINNFFTYGKYASVAAERAKELGMKVYSFDDKQLLAEKLREVLVPGDAVLFKASRGMKLEEVIDLYTAE